MIYEFRTYDLKPRTLGKYDATLTRMRGLVVNEVCTVSTILFVYF